MAPLNEKEHDQLFTRLGRIEEKLDTIPTVLNDHEKRISKVEFKIWVVWGVGVLIILAGGAAISDIISAFVQGGVHQ